MSHLEISRCERRRQNAVTRQEVVGSFLGEYGLSGQTPEQIEPERRSLFELAHVNSRLLTRGFVPIDPQEWSDFLSRVGRAPRRLQLSLLRANLLLRRPTYSI